MLVQGGVPFKKAGEGGSGVVFFESVFFWVAAEVGGFFHAFSEIPCRKGVCWLEGGVGRFGRSACWTTRRARGIWATKER